MAEDEDLATLQRILDKQKALVAKTEAKIAAAKAAAAAPKPVAIPAPSAVVVRKPPSLKAPQGYAGGIYTDKGRSANLFTVTHRAQAALYKSVRDHADWDKFWLPSANKFVSKSRMMGTEKQYHLLLKSGEIAPPRGHVFNSLTGRMVLESSVFDKAGALRAAFAHLRVKGGVLEEGGREVTVTCILFYPMTYEDAQGHEQPMTKAVYEQRKDRTLAHVLDADGHYHQEGREVLLNTTEEALAPWLPAGRTWWVRGAHFEDYVSLDTIKDAPIGRATSVRKHAYGTLAASLETFASSLSAIQFRNPVAHGNTPAIDALTIQHHGKPAMLFSPFLEPMANPAASRLEDWIVAEVTEDLPTEGGSKQHGQVVQLVLPPESGCGYEFVISTFGPCFEEHKSKVEAGRKKSRYAEVEMTAPWLYENVFHPGQAYDDKDLGLSLQQLGLFFKHFRVSLFVLDITGRLVQDASVLFWARKDIKGDPSMDQDMEALDEHIHPNCAYILAHNAHIYPINNKTMTERLRQYCWNANSFLWRNIVGLGKEASGEEEVVEEVSAAAPSARYSLGKDKDEAPIVFLPLIDNLATLDIHRPKLDKKGEVKLHAKSGKPLFHTRLRIAVPASMNVTLVELVERANYEPRVTMSGLGEILSLTIKVDGVSLTISAPHHLVPEPAEDDFRPWLPTKDIHDHYCLHDKALKASLRPSSALSVYSPSLRSLFQRHAYVLEDGRSFPVTPFYRTPLYYGTACEGPVTAVDRIKSYTSLLMELGKVPVFTEFCEFEPLDYERPWIQLRQAPKDMIKDPLQPSAEEALAQLEYAAAGGTWRTYTDKNLVDIVLSLRQQRRSEEDVLRILTVELEQPQGRAVSLIKRAAHLHPSERDRHSLYFVMRVGTLFIEDPKYLILDQDYCVLTFDTWLLCRDWPECHTLGVIKPFNLVKTNIVKTIRDLWASSLPTHLKKFLPNKHVGICGKSENRKSNTLLTQCAMEAEGHAARMGATPLVQRLGQHTYYFVTQEWRTELAEGFMPVHHAVLDAQRRVLYQKAVEVGLPVLAVKTDCLYFKGHDAAKDVPKRGTFDAIGSWHVQLATEHPVKEPFARVFEEAWLPNMHNEPVVRVLPIVDEYDAAEFAAIFATTNYVQVLADIPGAGKTYALKSYMATLGDKALFVTPYNALADDLVKGDNPAHLAITFHRLLGLLAHGEEAEEDIDEEGNVKVRGHDISGVTHICFDEVYCYNPLMLGQLKRWLAKNATMADGTERHFYAAGDANQNPPIYASCLNRQEMKAYYTRAIDTLFPNQIRLKVCKRVGAEQQQRVFDIKEAVLNTGEPLLDICRRFFTPITNLRQIADGMRAVCFTNESARCVNDYREQRTARVLEKAGLEVVRYEGRVFYVAQVLRCRKFHKTPRIYINYTYNVTGFEVKEGAVTGIYLEETGDWPWALSLVKRLFIYDHANTCHSLQGMTAASGIALFDVDIWCATREWFYTALTRTNDLYKVVFWDPAAGAVGDQPVVMRSDFSQLMEAKLRGYMDQDTAAGRAWAPEDYVDVAHIMELHSAQGGVCAHCAAWLPPRWKPADPEQATVDRLDNALAHVKGNCCLACLRCNRKREGKKYFAKLKALRSPVAGSLAPARGEMGCCW